MLKMARTRRLKFVYFNECPPEIRRMIWKYHFLSILENPRIHCFNSTFHSCSQPECVLKRPFFEPRLGEHDTTDHCRHQRTTCFRCPWCWVAFGRKRDYLDHRKEHDYRLPPAENVPEFAQLMASLRREVAIARPTAFNTRSRKVWPALKPFINHEAL
ncbi:hypothetical protein F4778DRAFT_355648 [Xylariomycetidae sp. FL2044]|nr:hypothetical protein F4778DRAFT_355648 [Xylariomycetidae sp. FL2044]